MLMRSPPVRVPSLDSNLSFSNHPTELSNGCAVPGVPDVPKRTQLKIMLAPARKKIRQSWIGGIAKVRW